MLYLTLTEILGPGIAPKPLGSIEIRQDRWEPMQDVASYSLINQGQCVGEVRGWRRWHGPWRLAQAALNTLYAGIELARDDKLRHDGQCNALSSRGQRCRLDARDGGYFCEVHDLMGKPGLDPSPLIR